MKIPKLIPNTIGGAEKPAASSFVKIDPHTGRALWRVSRSRMAESAAAVRAAREVQSAWADATPVKRGEILHAFADALSRRRVEISRAAALETGKSLKAALGETDGAVLLGRFYAGEGQRMHGRTTTSGVPGKQVVIFREPLGVAALIVAANTPVPNLAWKVFPALICGNASVLKAAEDAPATAWLFARIAREAGVPDGVLNVVQGYGEEAAAPLVSDPGVDVLSFTGSSAAGRAIAQGAGKRLLKTSLELGGKNAFVVADDANLNDALKMALLSAFSNAGQRCASASRIVVFKKIYTEFKTRLVEAAGKLKLGTSDSDDLGPLIGAAHLKRVLDAVKAAEKNGALVLTGGRRLTDPKRRKGFYLAPTVIERARTSDAISREELFGPVVCLYPAEDLNDALRIVNDSPYGLTACIHTSNVDRALEFTRRAQAGVVSVNGATYGSEPHLPFGGLKASGNGTREPGVEALDVYSNLKSAAWISRPEKA